MSSDNLSDTVSQKRKTKQVRKRKNRTILDIFEPLSRVTAFIYHLINLLLLFSSLATTGVILFTGGRNIGQLPTSGLITPPIAFMMWAIGLYAALGWLHKYYEDNRQQMAFAPKFWMFLLDDLILKFRLPSRLFPLFALVLLLLWILGYTDYYFQLLGGVWIILFVVLFFAVPFGGTWVSLYLIPTIRSEREKMHLATLLEKEWNLIEERIRGKLEGYQWFDTAVMKDLARSCRKTQFA